jgi:hypothetical protein
MIIDYSTPTGKLRMRLGDVSDLPFLPDSLYESVYAESNNNVSRSVVVCGQMILAQLAFKTHRKISLQLEVWGKESFDSYRSFIILAVTNPNFMDISPIPYNVNGTTLHPLIKFQEDWNSNYAQITQSQQLAMDAIGSPSSSALWYWPQ